MVRSMVASRERSGVWLRSRNSRTVLLERPMAFAFLRINASILEISGVEVGDSYHAE